MNSYREKLASLNRQYREILIKSQDGEREETVFYRRPTELEDNELRKAMEKEVESVKEQLMDSSDGKKSMQDQMREMFDQGKPENAINYIVLERIPMIREAAIREADLEELPKDAPKKAQDAWMEKFKPVFDKLIEEAKEPFREYPQEVLVARATETSIERLARERAFAAYRRCLVAQSLYGRNDDGGFELIYSSPEEVAEDLDKDTIDTLANRISEEIAKYRNLPLK